MLSHVSLVLVALFITFDSQQSFAQQVVLPARVMAAMSGSRIQTFLETSLGCGMRATLTPEPF